MSQTPVFPLLRPSPAVLASAALLSGVLGWAAPTQADDEPPPTLGVFVSEIPALNGRTVSVTETVLPGLALDVAPWPAEEGGGLAVLLVPQPAGSSDHSWLEDLDSLPRALYRLRGTAGDLAPVASELPPDIEHLALAPDRRQLWLGEEGRLYRLGGEAATPETAAPELELLLELPGFDLGAIEEAGLLGVDADGRAWLATPTVGRLRLFRLGNSNRLGGRDHLAAGERPDDSGLELRREVSLPVTVSRRSRGLVLRSLGVSAVDRSGERPVFVAGPGRETDHRSRHLLIDPERTPATDTGAVAPAEAAPDGEVTEDSPWIETWTRTDGPEDLDSTTYVMLDGRPVLVAATTRADKLGIFEKYKLRAFRLKADRTRAGKRPFLAVETGTRNWYHVEPVVLDYDGDGRDDLAVVQPEGLGAGKTLVELYLGRAGGFERKPKRTKLDIEAAAWHFGEDLDGDGTADLLLISGRLEVFRGRRDHRRKLREESPLLRVEAGRLASAG
ncbi:MAG: VCBS repeat-containing protein, partial [Holophagales bacterium]|nr:VCBS repeat-containing protein [Holophagales bacterium]